MIDKLAPLAKPVLWALLIAAAALSGERYFENEQLRILAEREASAGVLARAQCAQNVFQEVTVQTVEGGVFRCGAIRELPVDKEELARWYQAEIRRSLKAQGTGGR